MATQKSDAVMGDRNLSVIQVVPEASGGGAELLVRELHRALTSRGIQSKAVFFSKRDRDQVEAGERCLGVRVPRSPVAALRLRMYLRTILSEVPHENRVVVHLHLTWGLLYGVIACAGLPCELVYTEHSTGNKVRRIRGARYIFSEVYRRLDGIVSISRGVDISLASWLTRRAKCVPRCVIFNGARLLRMPAVRPRLCSSGLQLVAVGSLNRHKGFDILLRALALSKTEVAQLTLVGEGPEHDNLRNLACTLGIEERCHFVGWQDNVETWFHHAHCMVMSSRREGFGLVAVEAMSTGLPVIAPALPGISEVLGDTEAGFLFEPESAEDLAKTFLEVYRKLSQPNAIEKVASAQARQFSLDRMADNYLCVYRNLASS